MNTMKSSYLILRNVDFVAKYFPFFLQTTIRASFTCEITHSSNIRSIFNNSNKKSGGNVQTEEDRVEKIIHDKLDSPRVLDTLSFNNSSF